MELIVLLHDYTPTTVYRIPFLINAMVSHTNRCAVLRFTRLHDAEILGRLQQICALESVSYDMSGLESIIFTAEGDMRNALNALQSTVSGFGTVTSENVFKVCDQPHPQKLKAAIQKAREGKTAESMEIVMNLWGSGYAATDIIQTLFRVITCLLIGISKAFNSFPY